MLALRFAALLSIVVWVGGLIALAAVAAPAVFDVVAARQISEGRLLAGAIFGEILNRFTRVGYVCGLVLPISLITRAVLGPRPRRFALLSDSTSVRRIPRVWHARDHRPVPVWALERVFSRLTFDFPTMV